MASSILRSLREEDERRRDLVILHNALARQADPNAEQTPFRSGLSRVGATLQNIPSRILGTPRAETEFSPFSGTQEQQDELGPLREAALGAGSSEEFAAILGRPDLFPDPAAPEGPITRDPNVDILERLPGGGFGVMPGLEARPQVFGFDESTAGRPSERAQQGFPQKPGEHQRVPEPGTSVFSTTSPVLPGPDRLTPVPAGTDIAATVTAPGSPTEIVAEGREAPPKLSLEDKITAGIKGGLAKPTVNRLEEDLLNSAARRESLQDIRRAIDGNMDLLRFETDLSVGASKIQDRFFTPIFGEVGESRADLVKRKEQLATRIGSDLVKLIKEISGTAVSGKEREFLEKISVSLPTAPIALLARLDSIITLNDFKNARLVMWDGGGRATKPWLIQNGQVQARLDKETVSVAASMIQRGAEPEEAARLATIFVEEKFGISPGGLEAMSDEFDRGAPNFGQ